MCPLHDSEADGGGMQQGGPESAALRTAPSDPKGSIKAQAQGYALVTRLSLNFPVYVLAIYGLVGDMLSNLGDLLFLNHQHLSRLLPIYTCQSAILPNKYICANVFLLK